MQIVRCGGEIQRAEDTVRRLLAAYRLEGEVFAVPNCVWVSVRAPDGRVHTVMRRVPSIVTDIDGIERFNDLSRRLCADPPADPAELSALWRDMKYKDWFMALLDVEDYIAAKERCLKDYGDRRAWAKKMLVNIAKSGYFSSDRTIEQYNKDIWKLK